MHQDNVGLAEKPFSLTPDPKYFYRDATHGRALDELQEAIRHRAGFALVTGDAGAGKTMLCHALLDHLDRKVFTSFISTPSLSPEDLLRLLLKDFGIVSADEMIRGRIASVGREELLTTLDEFLGSLLPLGARAVLIIDEAQNLPSDTLELVSSLGNRGSDTRKLLQVVLVGQPILDDLVKAPALGDLDARIKFRSALTPFTPGETAAYIAHRVMQAEAASAVRFTPAAVAAVHKYSGGVPRLVNMLGEGAIAAAASQAASSIAPKHVDAAAAKMEIRPVRAAAKPATRKRLLMTAAGLVIATAITAAYVASQKRPPASAAAVASDARTSPPASTADPQPSAPAPAASAMAPPATPVGSFSVLVASFRQAAEAEALANDLKGRGLPVRPVRVVTSPRGAWHQVLVGPYADAESAERDRVRVQQIRGYADARVISG